MHHTFAAAKSDDHAGAVTLSLAGDLDADASAALDVLIINAVGQGGVRNLIVDLRGVSFLDAAGVRALIGARQAALRHGAALHLTNAKGIVLQVLRIVGLDPIHHSPAEP